LGYIARSHFRENDSSDRKNNSSGHSREAVPVEAIAVLGPYMFSGLAGFLFFIAAGRSVECSVMEGKKLVNNRVL
jgi:hypothetical protein